MRILIVPAALLLLGTVSARTPVPQRPRIPGVAHIAVRTGNLDAARNFYGRQLGYEEAFKLDRPEGGIMLVFFKVDDTRT